MIKKCNLKEETDLHLENAAESHLYVLLLTVNYFWWAVTFIGPQEIKKALQILPILCDILLLGNSIRK